MIKNSDLLYNRVSEFQTKRKAITDAYAARIAELESMKGSAYYTSEMQKADEAKQAALDDLTAEYSGYFNIALSAMSEANAHRGLTPPTAEHISILEALRMRESVTPRELDRAANSLKGNALALSVLSEIAQKQGHARSYASYCPDEMTVEAAEAAVNTLRAALADFMKYDTTRAARAAAKYQADLYGDTGEPVRKRPLFDNKAGCYAALAAGLTGDTATAFFAAVDGE